MFKQCVVKEIDETHTFQTDEDHPFFIQRNNENYPVYTTNAQCRVFGYFIPADYDNPPDGECNVEISDVGEIEVYKETEDEFLLCSVELTEDELKKFKGVLKDYAEEKFL